MEAQPREISCTCGHTYETALTVNWCPKCGQKIFETAKERRNHKINGYYMYAIIGLAIIALAYFFFQLIIIPVLSM